MAERAQVASLEAIESFRAALILYLSKARPALEEISSEVQRSRQWLQHDQRRLWENEMRTRAKKLERAKAELFSVELSRLQEVSAAQQMAVHRAEHSVRDAEAKLAMLKKWDRDLDNRTEPYSKQIEQMHDFMTTEMPRAVASLSQIIKALEAYSERAPRGLSEPAVEAPPAGASLETPTTPEPPKPET